MTRTMRHCMACRDWALPHPLDIGLVNADSKPGHMLGRGTAGVIGRSAWLYDTFRQVIEQHHVLKSADQKVT